jgi:predicted dienelactone hydrolase
MNVGCRALAAQVPLWILYPTRAAAKLEHFGPYPLEVATDAPIEGANLPLVVVSHGNGGSPWPYRGIATHLARAGFVVALLEHPGNCRSDNSLAGTAANLENRPHHVRTALDAVFESLGAPQSVAMIGHSLGGYTALALAGGRPCFPPDGPPVPVVRDPRIGALVLLAPASPWFMADGALADVDVPILMRTAEHDEHAPPLFAEIILRGVRSRARIDHRVVPNAGHFSFQSPFPPSMTRPDFPPSQDPPGFDRAAYQRVLEAEILAFCRRLT